jgi:predicted GIY-YIG superfamily endonuclease
MCWVYVLRSVPKPARRHVGVTADLERRLADHEAGRVEETARHRPWDLLAAFLFPDARRAAAFAAYLRTSNGKAFGKEHLWNETRGGLAGPSEEI